jgi:hypothetical protein
MGDTHDRRDDERQRHELGISVMEIATLPPALIKILRLVLRQSEISYPALCDQVAMLRDADPLSQAELDVALDTLCAQGWVIRSDAHSPTYRVNLRRKASSARGERHPGGKPASDMGRKIWAALDPDTADSGAESTDGGQQPE